MTTTKSTFADILNAPGMKEMIQKSTAAMIAAGSAMASMFPMTMIKPVYLGKVQISDASEARALHAELVIKAAPNPRSELETRIRKFIKSARLDQRVAISSSEPTYGKWLQDLANDVVRELIEMKILLRRPMRVDQHAADAWLAATCLALEP